MVHDKSVLLEIKDLRIEGYTGEVWVPIIKGVDLTLHRGEVMGLIGESGAGKSTIGAAAMGYARDGTRIVEGSKIEFDGMELTTATEGERRALRGSRIAYVAQSAAASFNPAHKIIDQHTEAPLHYRIQKRMEAQEDAMDLYERLRLPNPKEIGFRYPHQVSGGQLQRAMTAMAMSCRPDLIIFDEPTTALDVTTQIEVLAAIRDIVDQFNTAAIYITHDLAVVAQMADTIKVLLKGEEVEQQPTEEMLDNPQEDYTKSLWAVRSFERPQKSRPEGETPLISVQDVDASYTGGDKVLDGVSFDIHKGMTVAVVGESGSGKSTTARVITGLLPPSNGQVLFQGEPLPPRYQDRTKDQLRQAQMIYQMADTALNPKVRISEIIGRPAQFYSGLSGTELKHRVDELLDLIELDPSKFYNRYPPELSGGQKQRIGIARALAAEPSFIICDEVTSALDQLVAEGILKLLDRLQNELDLAYMFITHDLATVRSIADEVVVMQHGKVVEQGPKDKMFTPPHHPYTDLLLSSVPEMDPNWLTTLLEERGVDNVGEAADV
ncbi:MAG: ABC transporter ATP-binding protein [Marinovum algicola]|jgi:peptide/nickel transport system ATP-binding protein|uniref:Peptide/nickel transport system ATP-binding protein n=1 Tax=Marinovum algicola TaxID=42444 RepID=A0A975WE48_9RHOB|nr:MULTISPECIES: ABC transporter ATP-binding protein [Marinovum]AKO98577.1 ATPase component of various ABC-type transport system [Marinovum algicola DG 898]MDD9741314.1 ABC transporter ATP-binding protein [Marinovum sp. SP66]MDD9743002.1 ABC transporter ATP-binding protein [Marinovum sp. PR37]SEK05661.1 peptide/nickel transport system ATP-binding protein [Marinovum algicola]SLN72232.1 Glutathione import ATP-binding protein GsiA [Marinovum algicola]